MMMLIASSEQSLSFETTTQGIGAETDDFEVVANEKVRVKRACLIGGSDMNQEYNHKNIPLNTGIVRELICELYSGKEYVKRSVIIEEILQHHLNQGGTPPEIQLSATVSDVLRKMENEGRAEKRSGGPGFWKILSSVEHEGERDIFEGLKALEGRIERLEKVLLLVLSSEIGNYVSGSAEEYLRIFQSFTVDKVELLREEYGTLEKVIEKIPRIIEEKSHYR